MERSNGQSINGRGFSVLEPAPLEPIQTTGARNGFATEDVDSVATHPATTTAIPRQEEPLSPEPSPRKRPIKLILAAAGIGAIAAGAFGFHWWQYASSHEETDNATVAGHIHQISARVPGTVQTVLVDDNQQVKAGQPLAKLDPRDYQIKLQQAQTELAAAQQKANSAQINIALSAKTAEATNTQSQGDLGKAQAAIAQAQAQVAEAQAGVPQSQAQLEEAKANLQKNQTDYNRYTNLYNEGAISAQQRDTALQGYRVALAQERAGEEAVRQAQAKVAQSQQTVATAQSALTASQGGLQEAEAKGIQTQVSQSDFGTAKAAIAQSQVALRNAQLQLSYTTITAPTDGRIGRKTVEVGQQIQAGTPLMALVDNTYWITANFKETQLEDMHPGQAVEIKLDSFPHKAFTGHVDSLSPASGAEFALLPPDNATGNFTKVVQRVPVKVVFDADSIKGYESMIAPGMSAVVTVAVK
ncbi:MAG: HlyD family secretion protein [Stenomitos rutilans HA7619-LM2]|jgi:membrane fusion protein (multidrug efflux system)|nr:HlyD family secretion protein [Stenomitos rutilans HA7619-LM2]